MAQISRVVLLQQILGAIGVSPKIFGVLPEAAVAKLCRQHESLTKDGLKVTVGILMEEVPNAWNIKDGPFEAAKRLGPQRSGDKAKLLRQLSELDAIINQIGVIPSDAQALISSERKVLVHDLDLYSWLNDDGTLSALIKPEDFEPGAVRHRFIYKEPLINLQSTINSTFQYSIEV